MTPALKACLKLLGSAGGNGAPLVELFHELGLGSLQYGWAGMLAKANPDRAKLLIAVLETADEDAALADPRTRLTSKLRHREKKETVKPEIELAVEALVVLGHSKTEAERMVAAPEPHEEALVTATIAAARR